MNIENFELRQRDFNRTQVEGMRVQSYYLGTGHRQLFMYERYPSTIVMTDNASNCLAGFCVLPKGIYAFHDPPLRAMFTDLPLAKRARGEGLVGGALQHWEATKDVYEKRAGVLFQYVEKPEGQGNNVDYSFAFVLDMGNKTIDYGYYLSPKGLSGNGWTWEDNLLW